MREITLNREEAIELFPLMFDGDDINILSANIYKRYSLDTVQFLMHMRGIYVLPTEELIEWLRPHCDNAIEIGAGNGTIGRALGIPITDSHLQANPEIQKIYKTFGQPPIEYPADVEKLDALQAIEKYNPKTVIGAYITHLYRDGDVEGNMFGVDEYKVIDGRMYINIGNADTHKHKPILSIPHEEYHFDWIITRSADQSKNRIWVWQ